MYSRYHRRSNPCCEPCRKPARKVCAKPCQAIYLSPPDNGGGGGGGGGDNTPKMSKSLIAYSGSINDIFNEGPGGAPNIAGYSIGFANDLALPVDIDSTTSEIVDDVSMIGFVASKKGKVTGLSFDTLSAGTDENITVTLYKLKKGGSNWTATPLTATSVVNSTKSVSKSVSFVTGDSLALVLSSEEDITGDTRVRASIDISM